MVDITNIINVSTAQAPRGLGFYQVNNVMLITGDTPIVSFGADKYRAYMSYSEVVADFGSNSNTAKMAQSLFAQTPNLLSGEGQLLIGLLEITTVEETPVVEEVKDALIRLHALVYFGCAITTVNTLTDTQVKEIASTVSTMDCMFVYTDHDVADLEEGGLLSDLYDLGYTKFRPLLNTMTSDQTFSAGYVGRALSTNYNAQNSCSTLNLKDLVGFGADTAINQTVYNKCKALGVDIYCAIEGLPKLISNTNGLFFDEVYNRLWFTQALKVAYFNVLATTSTKIPQTEKGMQSIKNALAKICDKAVLNGFCAPGKWNGSDKFGNPEDFDRNISDFGYYIYSLPVSEQTQEDRTARKAPVVQIAVKEAGAIHNGSIIVNFEA